MSEVKAREAAARAVSEARRTAEGQYYLHGTDDPDVWTLRQRADTGDIILSTGEMAGQITAMNAAMNRDTANAAIDAYEAALAETHVRVPREPTEAMIRPLFEEEYPYILRRNKMYDDGKIHEIVRQDHPDWREVVADPMTVIARYSNFDEAETHFTKLVYEYRYAAMLAASQGGK